MTEWVKFLQPSAEIYNCWTFLEKIHPNIKVWNKDLQEIYSSKKHKWGDLVSFEYIRNLSCGCIEVTIKDIKSYDVLVFGVSDKRPQHFGLYIGNNQFIHYRKMPQIEDLTDVWRKKLKVIYRC